jgi:hypothetical protein
MNRPSPSSRPVPSRKPSLIERTHWGVRLAAVMVLFVICSALFVGRG